MKSFSGKLLITSVALFLSGAAYADSKGIVDFFALNPDTLARRCEPTWPHNSCTGRSVGDDCFISIAEGHGKCEVAKRDAGGGVTCRCL